MPMQRDLYPPDWPDIALHAKEAAGWQCQHCGARRGDVQSNRRGQLVAVQIQVAHLDHDPWNREASLAVLCRNCHLAYDARDRARKRVMMAIARGQMVLPGLRAWYQAPRLRLLRPGRVKRSAHAQPRRRGKGAKTA